MTLQLVIPFTTPGNYVFDSGKVEIDGEASLLGESGQAREYEETYATPGNYTIPESTKLEVTGGVAQLKLVGLTGETFNEDFASDTGFTYDSAKAEFSGGQVQQKLQAPAGETFFNSYDNSKDADRSDGSATGTLFGTGATVSGGKLNCNATGGVSYPGASNISAAFLVGAVRFKVTPGYSGTPVSNRGIISWSNAMSSLNNMMSITHLNSGSIQIRSYTSAGVTIYTYNVGAWSPTASQEYEFEFNWNFTGGAHRLFIDGVQLGTTDTTTSASRTSGVTLINVGAYYNQALFWDGSINDLQIFDAVQHTSGYTPANPPTNYLESNVDLPQFVNPAPIGTTAYTNFLATEGGAPRYQISLDDGVTWLYYSGGWVSSDETYAQSTTEADFLTNIAAISAVDDPIIRISLPGGYTQASVSDLTLEYSDLAYPQDSPTVEANTGLDASGFEGGVTSWDGFSETATKPANTEIYYIISDDNGTTWYYWNGSSWAVSDETVGQASTAAVIDTNLSAFTISDEFDYRAFLTTTDGLTTPQLDNVLLDYTTIGTFPIDNPTVTVVATFRTDLLEAFVETSTKPAGTTIQYYLTKNGTAYYWDGAAWSVSNGTYAQSSSAADINANAATFTDVGVTVSIVSFLHTDTVEGPTPELDTLTIDYDFTGDVAVSLEFSRVWAYQKDRFNVASQHPVYIQLENTAIEYKNQTIIYRSPEAQSITPDGNGYWEANLLETDNMIGDQHYIFQIAGIKYRRQVPNAADNNFWDLTEIE